MWFNLFLLSRFTSTNIRELEIEHLDIAGFMPRIREDFKYLLPTVRSLTLREPKGCHRQILYFIGLFQHLQDLALLFDCDRRFPEGQTRDPSLIPPFSPPLRGRLVMKFLRGEVLPKDMIGLFGRVRFRHMDLYAVDATSLLLRASSDTLETLRFYSDDRYGERLHPKRVKVLIDGFSYIVLPGPRSVTEQVASDARSLGALRQL